MLRFLHAADIHLDSPLKGLERYEGAPHEEIRQATRRALANLVQLAVDEAVDFVLIAGDLYDGDWKDYRTGLFFVSQMAMLREASIPVYVIAGNHDAMNKMTRSLPLPKNVQMFDHKKADTVKLNHLGVAIHGQSYPSQAVLDDLSAAYPSAIGGMFNIGMLHTCATGRDGHPKYAPCTVEGLAGKGYDYWALGHVHAREVLASEPTIVFPGNVQGRHIRESGVKGCILVEVDEQHRLRTEFRPLDVFRWQTCWIDAAGASTKEELLERFRQQLTALLAKTDGIPMAVRVETSGPCRAHQEVNSRPEKWINDVRSAALDRSDGNVWIEKVRTATTLPVDINTALVSDGPVGELVRLIDELHGNPEAVSQLIAESLSELRKKLPSELTEGQASIELAKPETTDELLEQVRHMLVSQVVSREVSA
jgi:DNA repair exonuclease SbcCD nuclease subunit